MLTPVGPCEPFQDLSALTCARQNVLDVSVEGKDRIEGYPWYRGARFGRQEGVSESDMDMKVILMIV